MRNSVLNFCFALTLIINCVQAQVPQAINYQAVARDSSGGVIPNRTVSIKMTITDGNGGSTLYSEIDTAATNIFGLFSLQIGNKDASSFSLINWGSLSAWLKVDYDPNGGSNFIPMGSEQLLSVPYALMAQSVSVQTDESLTGDGTLSNPLGMNPQTDGTIHGTGTYGNPLGISAQTDGTIYGDGSPANPLGMSINTDGSLNGNGSSGNPLSINIQANDPLNGAGTSSNPLNLNLQTDGTISGSGASGNPLSISASTSDPIYGDGSYYDPLSLSLQTDGSLNGDGSSGNPFGINAQTDGTMHGNGDFGSPLGINIHTDGSLTGIGSSASPLAVSIYTDNSLSGNGSSSNPLILNAQTDGSMNGNGSGANPLTINLQTNDPLTGTGSSSKPLSLNLQTDLSLTGNGTSSHPLSLDALTDATITGNGSSGNPLSIAQQGATPGQVLRWNGSTWTPVSDSGGFSGYIGTANYVSKFTDAITIGNSQIFDDGTNVGIGTATPGDKLSVQGGLFTSGNILSQGTGEFQGGNVLIRNLSGKQITIAQSGTNDYIQIEGGGTLEFNHLGSSPVSWYFNDGNVGIGIAVPANTLDVTGNTNITGNFVNTSSSVNHYGVSGRCNNTPGYGYGVEGYGGYTGVYGEASLAGSGDHIGVWGAGQNGNGNNYGVQGIASGGTNAYGIWGEALSATTNYAGYFSGDVYTTGSYLPSDRKLKTGIVPLTGALAVINHLKPSIYTYKTDEFKQMHLPEGVRYGLIADEVQQVLPGIVTKAVQPALYENHDEKNGKKLSNEVEFNAVNYTEIIPVLIAGMKEQQKMIEQLQAELNALKNTSSNAPPEAHK